eukprot:2628812-Alexandrium_andersonii.AAC.1
MPSPCRVALSGRWVSWWARWAGSGVPPRGSVSVQVSEMSCLGAGPSLGGSPGLLGVPGWGCARW